MIIISGGTLVLSMVVLPRFGQTVVELTVTSPGAVLGGLKSGHGQLFKLSSYLGSVA